MNGVTVSGHVLSGRCLVPVLLYPQGQPHRALGLAGLIDTGANRTAVAADIATLLGLPVVGAAQVMSPTASASIPEYACTIEFWNPGFTDGARAFPLIVPAMLTPMVGATILIGMDIIQHGSLNVGPGAIWSLIF